MKRFFLIACIGIVFPQDASAQSPSVRLQVFPSDRVLEAPHATQQLAVIAHFPNGVTRDVTRLTLFSSSDTAVATVNPAGLVRFRQGGEVAIFCRYQTMQSVRLTYREPKPGFVWPAPTCHNHVDRLMFAKWRLLSLAPSDLCSDRVFLRRAFIDLCGLLPTAREAQQFLSDPRPDRRTRLVDALLERDEYADRWAHHWATMLALPYAYRKPVQGAAYLQWVRGYVAHTGLDELARDIVLGKGVVTNAGPANFYTGGGAPDDWATRISEAFLGMRLQCSQCHLVSRTRWTPDDWHAFAAFFVQAVPRQVDADRGKIELVLLDLKLERLHPDTKKPISPRFPDGTTPKLRADQDRRAALADWLTSPKNPYFARNLANRIWLHLLGKGLADPPEQLHEMSLTANNELLDFLASELIAHRFDARPIIRLIMNSRVYQLSSERNAFNQDDEKYFSRSYGAALQSEVLVDVLNQFLELPSEPDGLPPGTRALRMFDERVHWIGFSRPQRLSVCEAEIERNLASHVHTLHSEWMQARLKAPYNRLGRLLAEKRSDREILDELFMTAFARLPTDEARRSAAAHLAKAKNRREAFEDIVWAIVNTKEFAWRP